MAWTTKVKALGISRRVAHATLDPSLSGRAPAIDKIIFSPLALYGAAARCSHLHPVDPTIVTPESVMITALLEQYVDDASGDFAIESTAENLKDFVKSYFAGTVAAGLSYLLMVQDGYVWFDHFENLAGGFAGVKKAPDFVFTGVGAGAALVEAKGSRGAKSSAFDAKVRDGYVDQVEPHLGHPIGGVTATHGYCIGAYLRSPTKADLRVHHTAVPAIGDGGDDGSPDRKIVQRGNYANAFTLAHSAWLGRAIRSGEGPEIVPFLRFEWRDRWWLTSPIPGMALPVEERFEDLLLQYWLRFYGQGGFQPIFAIAEDVGLRVLRRFLGGPTARLGEDFEEAVARPIDVETLSRPEADGVVFPDGFAILGPKVRFTSVEGIGWDRWSGQVKSR